jgi:hypothetical protein
MLQENEISYMLNSVLTLLTNLELIKNVYWVRSLHF